MRFSAAVDAYVDDMRLQGRMNSPATERDYRSTLNAHGEDVGNRDPRYVGRDDVKRTWARWPHPSSRRKNRAILVSFYDWLVEEGERPANPARQTRRPKARPTSV
jgi:site-specific recombinase XerC